MAAAAWKASGTLLGALTTNDVTPVIPAHDAGDLMICITANRVTSNTCSTPANWNLIGNNTQTNWRTYAFYRVALSSAETNPLCDWTATSADKYAQVHVIGNVDTLTPLSSSALSGDVTDPIVHVGGISTVVANQFIAVIGIGSDNVSASVTVTSTDPATYTQRHFSTIATGADATGEFHDATRATAGASGSVTLDHNSTMPAMGVLLLAINDLPIGWPFKRRPAHRFLTLR